MKIVPLKNKIVEYTHDKYPELIFELKLFDIVEGLRFYELAQQTVIGKPKEQEKAYLEVVKLGVKAVKDSETGEYVKESKLQLEWFILRALADEITLINSKRAEDVKK